MSALADPIANQAVEWMVLLRSGAATIQDREAFEGWRDADPRHEAACRRIEGVLGGLAQCQGEPVAMHKALLSRRRAVKGLLGLAAAGVVSSGLVRYQPELSGMMADHRTPVGRRQRITLADGGTLLLNARTSLNLSAQAVDLIEGEVLLRTPATGESWQIRTANGIVHAERPAALAVRHKRGVSRLAVLDGEILLQSGRGLSRMLEAGQLASFGDAGIYLLQGVSVLAETAWEEGLLQVDDRPLVEVVEALADYRAGVLRVASSAASMRVSGLFPLDEPDRALRAIASVLPVRIRSVTPWWVSIEAV
ncbi:MAG: hypothetical protein BSR46_02105 [Candidatus Dactylopiibacterium carminicum]|nr:DUF4880 domain-containing protein [Candidatus Dactylopiibacterium carminicum]PAT00514.1 MAG: hypothetical protein BSR46_02105 [Candidatus Dactylopiibacterium carminicum]